MNHFSTFTMLHIFCQIGIRKLLCCKYINVNIQFEYHSHTLCEQKSFLDYIFCAAAAAERVQLITEEQIQWQSAERKGKKKPHSRETNKKNHLINTGVLIVLFFPLQFYCSAAAIVSFKCVLYIFLFFFVLFIHIIFMLLLLILVLSFFCFWFCVALFDSIDTHLFRITKQTGSVFIVCTPKSLFIWTTFTFLFLCFLLLFDVVTVFLFIAKNISNRKSAQSALELIGSCDLS